MFITSLERYRRTLLAVAAILSAGLGLVSAWPDARAQDATFTAEQKKAIEKIIKDYLLANPEVFLEVQSALEAKMEAIQAEKLKAAIAENAKDIYRRADSPVAGNPNGDITIVEFFDYNCGYCKRGFPHVAKMIEKDPKVRLVLMELPILAGDGEFRAASENLRWAATVAGFAMLLKQSRHAGDLSLEKVRAFAAEAVGDDPGGYRAEFLSLVDRAREIAAR